MPTPPTDYQLQIETSEDRARAQLNKGWAVIAALDEVSDNYGLGVAYLPESERRMIASDLERRMRALSNDLKTFLKVNP